MIKKKQLQYTAHYINISLQFMFYIGNMFNSTNSQNECYKFIFFKVALQIFNRLQSTKVMKMYCEIEVNIGW